MWVMCAWNWNLELIDRREKWAMRRRMDGPGMDLSMGTAC